MNKIWRCRITDYDDPYKDETHYFLGQRSVTLEDLQKLTKFKLHGVVLKDEGDDLFIFDAVNGSPTKGRIGRVSIQAIDYTKLED